MTSPGDQQMRKQQDSNGNQRISQASEVSAGAWTSVAPRTIREDEEEDEEDARPHQRETLVEEIFVSSHYGGDVAPAEWGGGGGHSHKHERQTWQSVAIQVCFALTLGVIVGLVSVVFHTLEHTIEKWYTEDLMHDVSDAIGGQWWMFVHLTLGCLFSGLLTGWIARTYVSECIGGGNCAILICLALDSPPPIQIAFARVFLSSIYMGFGNPLGGEAPTLHIAATIAWSFHAAVMRLVLWGEQTFQLMSNRAIMEEAPRLAEIAKLHPEKRPNRRASDESEANSRSQSVSDRRKLGEDELDELDELERRVRRSIFRCRLAMWYEENIVASWQSLKKEVAFTVGTAAGISAAFNTPLSGILYVVEEYLDLRRCSPYSTLLIVTGAVASAAVARIVFGEASYLDNRLPENPEHGHWMYAAVLVGVVSGVVGHVFCLMTMHFRLCCYKLEAAYGGGKFHVGLSGLICGLVGCLCFIATGLLDRSSEDQSVYDSGKTHIWGVGKKALQELFAGPVDLWVGVTVTFLKILAVSIAAASGGPGGIFAPALVFGGTLGGVVGEVCRLLVASPPAELYTSDPEMAEYLAALGDKELSVYRYCVVFGMAGMFSAVFKLPLTSVVLVYELGGLEKTVGTTAESSMIFLVFIASMAGYVTSHQFNVYDIFERMLIQDGMNPETIVEESHNHFESAAEESSPDFLTWHRGDGQASRAASVHSHVHLSNPSAVLSRMGTEQEPRSPLPETDGFVSTMHHSSQISQRALKRLQTNVLASQTPGHVDVYSAFSRNRSPQIASAVPAGPAVANGTSPEASAAATRFSQISGGSSSAGSRGPAHTKGSLGGLSIPAALHEEEEEEEDAGSRDSDLSRQKERASSDEKVLKVFPDNASNGRNQAPQSSVGSRLSVAFMGVFGGWVGGAHGQTGKKVAPEAPKPDGRHRRQTHVITTTSLAQMEKVLTRVSRGNTVGVTSQIGMRESIRGSIKQSVLGHVHQPPLPAAAANKADCEGFKELSKPAPVANRGESGYIGGARSGSGGGGSVSAGLAPRQSALKLFPELNRMSEANRRQSLAVLYAESFLNSDSSASAFMDIMKVKNNVTIPKAASAVGASTGGRRSSLMTPVRRLVKESSDEGPKGAGGSVEPLRSDSAGAAESQAAEKKQASTTAEARPTANKDEPPISPAQSKDKPLHAVDL